MNNYLIHFLHSEMEIVAAHNNTTICQEAGNIIQNFIILPSIKRPAGVRDVLNRTRKVNSINKKKPEK